MHHYRLTTPEEQRRYVARWLLRRMRILAACPPRQTLATMMRRNRAATG